MGTDHSTRRELLFAGEARRGPTPTSNASQALVILTLALLPLIGFGQPPPAGQAFYRFTDNESPSGEQFAEIEGTMRRVLNPSRAEERFSLPAGIAGGVLDVSLGLRPEANGAKVHFEVLVETAAGLVTPVLRQDITTAGWQHMRTPISMPASGRRDVIFRRTMIAGPPEALRESSWGNPVLLTGSPDPRPSVVLISIDTLRADQLGAYGNTAVKTPTYDALANSSVVFERALSPSSWTLPSHAALLHGAVMSAFPTGQFRDWHMPERLTPLAETFQQNGYLTAAFTGGGYLDTFFGFARGFDEYSDYQKLQRFHDLQHPHAAAEKCRPDRFDGETVFRETREWLQDHAGVPFFLFVHTYEVHDACPFKPPGRWRSVWPYPGPAEAQRQLAYYDGLVMRSDDLLVSLLHQLDALQLSRSTLVVLTSDHGEGFWEHGFRRHGQHKKLYEELVHVPLMFRWPGHLPSGRRVPEPVSLVHVAPTVLRLVKLPRPASMLDRSLPGLDVHFPGRDALAAAVFRRLQGGSFPGSAMLRPMLLEPAYVQCDDLLAVREARYKLLTTRQGGPVELYDLAGDPGEKHDLASQLPAVAARLEAAATAYWQRAQANAPAPRRPGQVDAGTRERLRALGYAGR
jgi:arylsulfatase A-like enzyme